MQLDDRINLLAKVARTPARPREDAQTPSDRSILMLAALGLAVDSRYDSCAAGDVDHDAAGTIRAGPDLD